MNADFNTGNKAELFKRIALLAFVFVMVVGCRTRGNDAQDLGTLLGPNVDVIVVKERGR